MTRRDVVRLLLKMSLNTYGIASSYNEGVLSPIITAGESLYGSDITTYTMETDAAKAFWESLQAEFEDNASVADGGLGIDAAPKDSTGVHAVEFSSDSLGRVLAFRGTQSDGDFDNIKPWISEWILKRMTSSLKHQWVNKAGLTWEQELQDDQAQFDPGMQTLFTIGSGWFSVQFLNDIEALATSVGVSGSKARKTGYWEFSKVIADSVRDSLNTGESLTLTGHSQGGSRAALVSMYFEKKYGTKYDTVTFAATGGLCFTRDLYYTSGNMKDDLDPYIMHDQITEYVHPLDAYGFFDYDAGEVCLVGTTDVATSRAKKYCQPVFGHQGVDLMIAGQMGLKEELADEFRRCRYFTHSGRAMFEALMDDNLLLEDGKTDGGCTTGDAIPESDPNKLCPHSSLTSLDGCDNELSCETCSISTSETGLDCRWCNATSKCRSWFDVYFEECSSEWVDPDDTCNVASAAVSRSPAWVAACMIALPLLTGAQRFA